MSRAERKPVRKDGCKMVSRLNTIREKGEIEEERESSVGDEISSREFN